MQSRTTGANPSDETIKIGPIEIRFLLTRGDSKVEWFIAGQSAQKGERGRNAKA